MGDILDFLRAFINGEPTVDIKHLSRMAIERIEQQQQEIEQLRELVGDVLIDNHRHGYTTPKTLNEIQNYVSKGKSDE